MEKKLMENHLTEREMNVLFYLAQGLTNEEISANLHISVHTVKAHLCNIYKKLEVGSRTKAIILAERAQILN